MNASISYLMRSVGNLFIHFTHWLITNINNLNILKMLTLTVAKIVDLQHIMNEFKVLQINYITQRKMPIFK